MSVILKPYERRTSPGTLRRFLAVALLIGLSSLYGLMSAILPVTMISLPLVPIFILIAIILWMLPEVGGIYQDYIQRYMIAYVGLGIVWPNYVAFTLPGLPWITPVRVAAFLMVGVAIINFATSREFRDRVNNSVAESPLVKIVFWGFWGATTFSLAFSTLPSASFPKYFNNQIFWTAMFPIAAFLATREGFVMKLSRVMVVGTAVVMIAGLYEYHIQRVSWLDHLPFFLKVDPDYLAKIMVSQSRAGTDIYRVRGTFATSLYFSEFLTMVFPLFLHFAAKERRFVSGVLLMAGTVGMTVVMYLTNARSAMVGLLVTAILYVLFSALRRYVGTPRSIFGIATLLAYPAMMITTGLIVQFWHRAHVMVLGGGQHQASSDARSAQWAMGWPKILSHPFGHGLADTGGVLGYYNAAGEVTVDSHYLSLMLDSGLMALPLFLACFLLPSWLGFIYFPVARTSEQQLIAPLSLGLVSFVIVKSVLTSEGSVPLAFVMAGCIMGLIGQMRRTGQNYFFFELMPSSRMSRSSCLPIPLPQRSARRGIRNLN